MLQLFTLQIFTVEVTLSIGNAGAKIIDQFTLAQFKFLEYKANYGYGLEI